MRNEFNEKSLTVLMDLKAKLVAENVMDAAHKVFYDSYAGNLLNILGGRNAATAASTACTTKIAATNTFIVDLDAMILEYNTNGNG